MAFSGRIFVLAFFIALSLISTAKVAVATRKLLQQTWADLPSLPGLQFPPLPPLGFIPDTPIWPEYKLPPPITSFADIPFTPAASVSTSSAAP
jgi:hypothetical protein